MDIQVVEWIGLLGIQFNSINDIVNFAPAEAIINNTNNYIHNRNTIQHDSNVHIQPNTCVICGICMCARPNALIIDCAM